MLAAQEVLSESCNAHISKCLSASGTWAGLLALGEAGEISAAADLLLSPGAVRAVQPLSGLSLPPLVLPSCHEQPGLWAHLHTKGVDSVRGFIALQAGVGGRTGRDVSSMAAHPTGLQHGHSQHRGLLPPHLHAQAQRAMPQPGTLRQGGTGAANLLIWVLKRWAGGFICCCRWRKSVSTGGEGSSAGTRGVCPHVTAAWPWGGVCWAHCANVGCPRRCSFQPHAKKCHFPASSQVFLILS